MESPGARIKKIRLEKGISLEEVQKKTKIHLDILKSLEDDSLINLNPVYIKGFLKIYSKLLGVDPHGYILNYKEPQYALDSILKVKENPASFLEKISAKFSVLKIVKLKMVFKVILIAMVIFGLFKLGNFIAHKHVASGKKTKLVAAAVGVPEKKIAPVVNLKRIQNLSPIRLGIRAKENCWVRLKADGRMVFQGVLKRGRSENWEAKEKIELSLGNAGAVDLEINGKLIPSLGRKGQVLNNVSVTREGLNIGR